MSNFNQIYQDFISYINSIKRNKTELLKISILLLFSIYLTIKFLGSFESTLGYDIRSEFSGYMIILSFFNFLFISFKQGNFNNLKLLSFFHLIICLLNFLIIKSFSTLVLFKIIISFFSIFLLLIILREIKNR